MEHSNILKHPAVLAIPITLVLFIYFLSQSSLFNDDNYTIDISGAAPTAEDAEGTAINQSLMDYIRSIQRSNIESSEFEEGEARPPSDPQGRGVAGLSPSLPVTPSRLKIGVVNGRPIYRSSGGISHAAKG